MDQKLPADVQLRDLALEELDQVARIHCDNFPDNLYTRLGPKVVSGYFAWHLANRSHAQAIGLFDPNSGRLLAYAIGSDSLEPSGSFIRSRPALVASRLMMRPRLMTHPHFRIALQGRLRALSRRADRPPHPNPGQTLGRFFEGLSVAVDPAVQSRGLGAALLEEFESYARGNGFVGFVLEAPVDSPRAIAFYERFGFVKASEPGGSWTGQMLKHFE